MLLYHLSKLGKCVDYRAKAVLFGCSVVSVDATAVLLMCSVLSNSRGLNLKNGNIFTCAKKVTR